MKGVVFTILNDMVESEFGIEVWEELLATTQPSSGGAYTSVEVYPDGEMLAFVSAIAQKLAISENEVLFKFGKYLLSRFAAAHADLFEGHDAKSFLQSIDAQIHVEVRKLHPGVILPKFEYIDPGDGGLVMHYHSPRKLCHLAEGLIAGTAEHFDTRIDLTHDVCMHRGAPHCEFALRFGAEGANEAA